MAWALGFSGRVNTQGIAVDNTSVYVCGQQGGAGMGFGSSGFITVDAGGFVGKLTDAGTSANWNWALPFGQGRGSERDTNYSGSFINGLAASGGGVYIAGSSYGKLTFGSTVLPSTNTGMLVTKLADAGTSGAWEWVKKCPGAPAVNKAVAVSGADVYVAGSFAGAFNLDNIQLSQTAGAAANTSDIYIAKLAGSDGRCAWAQSAGGTGGDDVTSMAFSSSGRVYVTGSATPPAQFGSFALTGTATPTAYLAALGGGTATATAPAADGWAIGLSPNPTHGAATLQLPLIPGASTATLTLLDALGRTLRTQPAALNARTELDLTGFGPGLYAVRVQAGGSSATQRLVVE